MTPAGQPGGFASTSIRAGRRVLSKVRFGPEIPLFDTLLLPQAARPALERPFSEGNLDSEQLTVRSGARDRAGRGNVPALCAELKIRADGTVPLVNSRDVAEVFGKRHADVLRDIRALEIDADLRRSWFRETTMLDAYGREQPSIDRRVSITDERG